jgi:hypothetical protein
LRLKLPLFTRLGKNTDFRYRIPSSERLFVPEQREFYLALLASSRTRSISADVNLECVTNRETASGHGGFRLPDGLADFLLSMM